MFVAEYWNDWWTDGPRLEMETSGRRQTTPQGAGHIYIGYRKYLYHISNGCSSSEIMHVIVEVICGSSV